jgi:hypothetical protein
LRKATINFVMSVRMKELGSHCKDFHGIWYLSIFLKSLEKIQVSLKSDENNGTLLEDQYTFLIISLSVFLRLRNVSKKCSENQNTHFMFSNIFQTLCSLWNKVGKYCGAVFLNRRAAARYRALTSIIPGRERPEETTVCYKISLVQLITNLNVILYLSIFHTIYISVLILFMIMP